MVDSIISIESLSIQSPWPTEDPFLMTVYHKDDYPEGNDEQGPNCSLAGRNLGEDFIIKDGFRMYHGKKVPGFPAHPHRGFETVTIVLKGFVDHFDSTGSVGRYGNGDVQWLTTGKGCQHSEMFPLVYKDQPNPLELFQIWLNLSKEGKSASPDYNMLWAEDVPVVHTTDDNGKKASVRVIAGQFNGQKALEPNRASWAKDPENHVGIFVIKMEREATVALPAVSKSLNRNVYFYEGESITIDGEKIPPFRKIKLHGDKEIKITNGSKEGYLLVLEGEPINEPVVQYGPFVVSSEEELQETFREYQQTQFGGWPWPRRDPVNKREDGRFARYPDGTVEKRD